MKMSTNNLDRVTVLKSVCAIRVKERASRDMLTCYYWYAYLLVDIFMMIAWRSVCPTHKMMIAWDEVPAVLKERACQPC
jgi:hypothetical protein